MLMEPSFLSTSAVFLYSIRGDGGSQSLEVGNCCVWSEACVLDDLSIIYCNINEFDINNKRLQRFCLKTYTNKTFPVITHELENLIGCFLLCNLTWNYLICLRWYLKWSPKLWLKMFCRIGGDNKSLRKHAITSRIVIRNLWFRFPYTT